MRAVCANFGFRSVTRIVGHALDHTKISDWTVRNKSGTYCCPNRDGAGRDLGRCMKSWGSPAKSGMVGNASWARCLVFVYAKFHYRALVFIVGVVLP